MCKKKIVGKFYSWCFWFSFSVDATSSDEEERGKADGPPKKKKKKSERKRKKKKKHKKHSGGRSGTSGSDSETIYPSDLKREEQGVR